MGYHVVVNPLLDTQYFVPDHPYKPLVARNERGYHVVECEGHLRRWGFGLKSGSYYEVSIWRFRFWLFIAFMWALIPIVGGIFLGGVAGVGAGVAFFAGTSWVLAKFIDFAAPWHEGAYSRILLKQDFVLHYSAKEDEKRRFKEKYNQRYF